MQESLRLSPLKALVGAFLIAACSGTTDRPAPTAALVDRDYEDFVSWFEGRGITLPDRPPAPEPAGKAAQEIAILGDGTGNGSVSFWDLWHLWNHLTQGMGIVSFTLNMNAYDIDRDGDVDWIDLGFLGDYLYGGSGDNPHDIGQPIKEDLEASLSPHPDTLNFVADGAWKRFVVHVSEPDSSVFVMVNGLNVDTVSLEISARDAAPGNYCPAERADRVGASDGDVLWIAGCSEGDSSIMILSQDETILWIDISVPVGPSQ